jgi:hypothetical protein
MIASCQDASQSFIVLRWYSSRYDVFCSMATLVFLCFSHGYLVLQLIKATKNYMKLVCILVHNELKRSLWLTLKYQLIKTIMQSNLGGEKRWKLLKYQ